jgi:hypothetical protein
VASLTLTHPANDVSQWAQIVFDAFPYFVKEDPPECFAIVHHLFLVKAGPQMRPVRMNRREKWRSSTVRTDAPVRFAAT